MGLDISHIKLIKEPIDLEDYLLTDSWELDCNVPFEVYKQFVSEHDTTKAIAYINLVKSENDLQKLARGDYLFFHKEDVAIVGKDFSQQLEEEEERIKKKFGDRLERYAQSITVDYVTFTSISYGYPVKEKIFYFKQVGYQRKGMVEGFYEHFKEQGLRGKIEDFEKAYTFIDTEWIAENHGSEEAEKFKNNFRLNFLDSYVFGESLLDITW